MLFRLIGIAAIFFFCALVVVAHVGSNGAINAIPGRNRDHDATVRNAKAKEVHKYMDLSVDPCVDFYDFACGNWGKYHKVRRENEVTTPLRQLEQRINKELQGLLEAQPSPHETSDIRKLNDFYRSCVNVDSKSTAHHDFMLNFVKNYGGLPSLPITNWNQNYNWVQVVAQLRANYGLDILMGLEIDVDGGNRKRNIFLTEPKTSLLPIELCSEIATNNMNIKDEAYESIQHEISQNMQLWFSLREADAIRFAGDIVRFEFELCKHMRKDHSMRDETPNEMDSGLRPTARTGQSRLYGNNRVGSIYPRHNLQQFTQQFGGIIDFKYFVDTSLRMTINTDVYMRSETYYQHLARTVKTSSKPTLANYIIYRAVAVLNFPSDDRPSKRPKYCVDILLKYFPKVLGETYNKRMQRSELRADVEMLYGEVSRAFEQNMIVDWLEENARRVVRQRLLEYKLKFPVYENADLNDLQIENLNYWRQLEEILRYRTKQLLGNIYSGDYLSNVEPIEATNAALQLMERDNDLRIGWGLLQPPIYDFFYSNAVKYSTLGQQMARELVAIALNDQSYFTEYDAEGFQNRSECVRSQYSNYLYNNPHIYRNASKLRQITAETSGLNIAFSAYLGWLENTDPSHRLILLKETLPEVNFSNTQLFFISFAQAHCVSKYDDEPPPDFLPLDKHTPERYQVNGPLSNSIEFAREFGCTTGAAMHPDDKCVIF